VVKEVDVILISSLPQDKVRKLFFMSMENIAQAINYINEKHSEDFKTYILPMRNTVLLQLF